VVSQPRKITERKQNKTANLESLPLYRLKRPDFICSSKEGKKICFIKSPFTNDILSFLPELEVNERVGLSFSNERRLPRGTDFKTVAQLSCVFFFLSLLKKKKILCFYYFLRAFVKIFSLFGHRDIRGREEISCLIRSFDDQSKFLRFRLVYSLASRRQISSCRHVNFFKNTSLQKNK